MSDTIPNKLPQKKRLLTAFDLIETDLNRLIKKYPDDAGLQYIKQIIAEWIKELSKKKVYEIDDENFDISTMHANNTPVKFEANLAMFVCILKALRFSVENADEFKAYVGDNEVILQAVYGVGEHLSAVIKKEYDKAPRVYTGKE